VWATVEHQGITWCNQLMEQLAALLLQVTTLRDPRHEIVPLAEGFLQRGMHLPSVHSSDERGGGGGEPPLISCLSVAISFGFLPVVAVHIIHFTLCKRRLSCNSYELLFKVDKYWLAVEMTIKWHLKGGIGVRFRSPIGNCLIGIFFSSSSLN
jgi:hypothetical protein